MPTISFEEDAPECLKTLRQGTTFRDVKTDRTFQTLSDQYSAGHQGVVFKVCEVSNPSRILALKISWNREVSAFEHEREVSQLKKLAEGGAQRFLPEHVLDFWVQISDDVYHALVTYPFCPMTMEKRIKQMQDCYLGAGWYTKAQAMKWGMQICEAMRALDDRSILHGDLAIRNILLDDNETVVIVDFGLAVNDALSGTSKSLLLQDYYGARAPEWNEKAEYIDSGLDAYHAGCCIFNILTVSVSQDDKDCFLNLARTGSAIEKFYLKRSPKFSEWMPVDALQALNGLIRERHDRMPISCAHTLMELAYAAALTEEGFETYAITSDYKRVNSDEEALEELNRAGRREENGTQRGLIDAIHITEEVWTYAFFGEEQDPIMRNKLKYTACVSLSKQHEKLQRFARAERLLEQAIRPCEALFGEYHFNVAEIYKEIYRLSARRGVKSGNGLEEKLERALTILRRKKQTPEVRELLYEVMLQEANCKAEKPKQEEARLMRRFYVVINCKASLLGEDHPDLIPILISMSIFYRHMYYKYQASLSCYDEAQRILAKAMQRAPERSQKMKELEEQYAGILWGGGHIRGLHMPLEKPEYMQKGLEMLHSCLRLVRKHFREEGLFTSENDFFRIPNVRKMLGLCYKRCKKYELAKKHLEACLPGFIKHLNINHHHVQWLNGELASVLQNLDEHCDAVELLSKCLANGVFPEVLGMDRGQDSILLSLLYTMFQSFCHLYYKPATATDRPSFEWLKWVHAQITMHLKDLDKSFRGEKLWDEKLLRIILMRIRLMESKLTEIAGPLSLVGMENMEEQQVVVGGTGGERTSQGNYKRPRQMSWTRFL